MDVITPLVTSSISAATDFLKATAEERTRPDRRKALALVKLYRAFRACHEAYLAYLPLIDGPDGGPRRRAFRPSGFEELLSRLFERKRWRWRRAIRRLGKVVEDYRDILEIFRPDLLQGLSGYHYAEGVAFALTPQEQIEAFCREVEDDGLYRGFADFERGREMLATFIRDNVRMSDLF